MLCISTRLSIHLLYSYNIILFNCCNYLKERMVFAAKTASSKSWSNDGNWGMGLLFVFFHNHSSSDEEDRPPHPHNLRRKPSFSLSSSSTIANAALLSKTQFTLFICILLFFTTLLLFSLFPPFEPPTTIPKSSFSLPSHHRRVLRQIHTPKGSETHFPPALHGVGALYRRGSKAMTDLLVGHVADGAQEREVRTFLRLVHHSGLLSRSDLVLIYESPDSAGRHGKLVKSECDLFLRLVRVYRQVNWSSLPSQASVRGLNRYLRSAGEDEKEALWGKKAGNLTQLAGASYGSVVGFDSSELDPENSLSGFLGRVPISLRRWACYPMLLGRVRRNYKHTMLVDVGKSLILSDPFSPVRNRSTESVLLFPTESTQKNSADSGRQLNPSVILGGGRGVRRFANSALTEIVRAVVEHKGKGRNSVTESGLVNQLAHNEHLLKNVYLILSDESIPELSQLGQFNLDDSADSGSGLLGLSDYLALVGRGLSGGGSSGSVDVDSVVRIEICSSHQLYSTVFRDCLATQ